MKTYLRSIYNVHLESKKPRTGQTIYFLDKDLTGVQTPYDNFVVMTIVITNYKVREELVDNGSSTNILFYNIFIKLKFPVDRLALVENSMYGFIRKTIMLEGVITLPMLMAVTPKQVYLMVDFLMVKESFAYSIILGRFTLRISQAMVSTYYLLVKFSTT